MFCQCGSGLVLDCIESIHLLSSFLFCEFAISWSERYSPTIIFYWPHKTLSFLYQTIAIPDTALSAGTWRRNSVNATSMRRHNETTSHRRQCDGMTKQRHTDVNATSWRTTSHRRQCNVMTSHRFFYVMCHLCASPNRVRPSYLNHIERNQPLFNVCEQQRRKQACASVNSDQPYSYFTFTQNLRF